MAGGPGERRFRRRRRYAAQTFVYTSIKFLEKRALFPYYAGPPDWFYHPSTIIALDGNVRPDQTFPALLERDVTPYGSKIVILTAGSNDASYIDPGPTARTEPRRVCLTNGIEQVDVYTAYYGWTGFETSLPDGVHPNAEGLQFIADVLTKTCRDDLHSVTRY